MNPTSCPDRQVLLDYHTGKLAEAVAKGVSDHISSCPACQATLKTFGDSADSRAARLRRAKPEAPHAHEPQRQQMLDRVKAMAETIVLRESPSPHVAGEPVALGGGGVASVLPGLRPGGAGSSSPQGGSGSADVCGVARSPGDGIERLARSRHTAAGPVTSTAGTAEFAYRGEEAF